MQLGLVTYNLAKDWDIATLIDNCASTGFAGVELRTTHAHGVEPTLDAPSRERVRQRFADSPVRLLGLGTIFEFHALDPDEVRRNIEGTKEYVRLAHDVGARGVKVRPNGHQESAEVPRAKTLEQVGLALRECAAFAVEYGVEIWMEMHGSVQDARDMRQIVEVAAHPAARLCWNSNPGDVKNGSIGADFDLVGDWVSHVHMRDLYDAKYPWRELFCHLRNRGYTGFCCAEVGGSLDPMRVMRYYDALFKELSTDTL